MTTILEVSADREGDDWGGRSVSSKKGMVEVDINVIDETKAVGVLELHQK